MGSFKKSAAMAIVLAVCVWGSVASGQEFAGLLRDETALGLKPTVENWGMGGAYVGMPGPSSMNPAALAFADASQVTVSTGHWNPDYGSNVNSVRLNAIVPVQQINGSVRLMGEWFATRDRDATMVPIGETEFHATTIGLQAGTLLSENIAAGLGIYPYEKAEIDYHNPATGAKVVDAEAMSQLGSIQGGVQWRVLEELTLGIEGIYIIDELQAQSPAGSEADDFYARYVAAGLCWQPLERTTVSVDYRNGEIEGASTALTRPQDFDQDVDRWSFGISHEVVDGTTVRIGSKNGGMTAGVGQRISDFLRLNYVYVDEAFRDKENAFGRVALHKIALTYTY